MAQGTKEKNRLDDENNPVNRVGGADDGKGDLSPSESAAFDQIAAANKDAGSSFRYNEANANIENGNEGLANQSALMPGEQELQNRVGRGYNARVNEPRRSNRARNAGIGVLITLILSIVGIVMLLPSIAMRTAIEKMTSIFMDRVNYITEMRVEKYVSGYLQRVVGPSINRCGTHISKNCSHFDPGRGYAANLYTTWRESRLEEKLSTKYGFEFERFENNGTNEIRVYKRNAVGIRGEVGTFGSRQVTKEMTKAIKTELSFENVRDRWRLRSLLADKYQASRWCFIACEKRDSLENSRLNAVTKAKIKITARVVEPMNEKVAAYMLCFIANCDADAINKQAREAAEKALKDVDGKVVSEIAEEIGNRSISQYLAEKAVATILEKLAVPNASRVAASSVPLAGQVYLAITIADLLDRIDEKIENKEISQYIMELNKSGYANYFALWQATNDDLISGQASLEDIGAMSTIMRGYDQSRVWQKANGIQQLSDVECADNVILTGNDGALACPEKQVRPTVFIEEWRQNDVVQRVEPILNTYGNCIGGEAFGRCPQGEPKKYIRPILQGVNWVVEGAGSLLFSAVSNVPILGDFIDDITSKIGDLAGDLFALVGSKIFPRVVNADAEGQEAFDQFAAGIDVSANEYIKGSETEESGTIGLGGSVLTEAEEAELQVAVDDWQTEETKSKSFFARYFDFSNPDSLVATAALGLDSQIRSDDIGTSLTNIAFANPFSSIVDTIISPGRAYAQPNGITNRSEIFGVEQYGYTAEQLDTDIQTLSPEVCEEYERIREESKTRDLDTGEIVYTTTNLCMLDAEVTETLAKPSNLDDPNASNGSSAPGGSGLVSPEGYAFPIEPQTKSVGGINNSHHDGTPAFDLFSSKDADVYAIFDGVVDRLNTNFNGVSGCTSIQLRAADSYYYWYGHLKNPVVTEGQSVSAGTKLAEVADQSFGSDCVGGGPHLHIDRGCVRNGVPQRGGSDSCRDPDFIPFLRALWQELPDD